MINKLQKGANSSKNISLVIDDGTQLQKGKSSPTKLPKLNRQQSFQKNSQKQSQKNLNLSKQELIQEQNDEIQVEEQAIQEQQREEKKKQKLSFKKYQAMSQQMNNQLTLQKALYNRTNTSSMLARYGGKVYKSLDKNGQQTNIDNAEGKQEGERNQSLLSNKNKQKKQLEQIMSQNPSSLFANIKEHGQSRQLRKRTRLPTMTSISSTQLRKQLSVNKVFYENPVKKIGYNMQFQSKLRFQHLEQLEQFKLLVQEIQGGDTIKDSPVVSIVYFIKDCEFRPNIITEKNRQTPICVAVIPEYFHSKVGRSNFIRHKYLERMKAKMNNTYDPEVMSRWPRITQFPLFNSERYNKLLRRFYGTNQLAYNSKWAEHIFKLINYPLIPQTKAVFLRQIWQVFNKSNAVFNLDYVLKDPFYIKKFQVSPYLGTRFITSKKILYHGGYSKQLYASWCSYVKAGKKLLSAKLKKYNLITQNVWTWLQQFDHLIFFQTDFIKILDRPLSIKTFKKLQQRKIQELRFYLTNTWMRGVMMIFYNRVYLQTQVEEYHDLRSRTNQIMKDFVIQLKKKINDESKPGTKHYLHSIQQKTYQSYCDMWTSVRKEARKSVKSQSQFLQIYGMGTSVTESQEKIGKSFRQIIPEMELFELQTLLSIQFSSIVQNSLSSLKELIIEPKRSHIPLTLKKNRNFSNTRSTEPIIRLTLIVDRQNIRLRQKQDDVIEMFDGLIQDVFGLQIESFGIRYDWSKSQGGNVLMGGGDRGRKLTRFFIEPKVKKDHQFHQKMTQQSYPNTTNSQIAQSNSSYPQVIKVSHEQMDNNNQLPSPLSIRYRYAQNHQRELTQIFTRVHSYYKDSQKIMQLFTPYLPFIKLTTSKYIFHEQEDFGRSAQDIFTKDLKIIKEYRQKLKKISPTYHIKIFEINCQEPIRELNQRMNEVQYLIEQKFMNKLFDNVHEIEKKLIKIKNQLHSCEVKLTNVEEVEKRVKQYDQQIIKIQEEVRQLERRVAFCFSLQKIQTTLVIRFQQLVSKKIEVSKQLRAFKLYLQRAKPQLQQKIINQAQQISLQLSQLDLQLAKIQQVPIDINTLRRLLNKLQIYGEKISLYQSKIKEYKQSAQYVLPSNDIDEIVSIYEKIKQRYLVIKNLWIGIQAFYIYLNKDMNTRIRQISITIFSKAISYARYTVDVYHSQIQTNLKRIQKNTSQLALIGQFVKDVQRCEEMRMVVEILSNQKVKDRHWERFGLTNIKNIKFKDLMGTQDLKNQNSNSQSKIPDDNKSLQLSIDQSPALQETVDQKITPAHEANQQSTPPAIPISAMLASSSIIDTLIRLNSIAQKEHEISTLYESIKASLKQSKLRIIDVNGSDILDTQQSLSILELLYNSKIELQINLQTKQQSCQFLNHELNQLLESIDTSYERLTLWIEIQHHYLKLSGYYVQNEEFTEVQEFARFQQVKQLHRKLIKSFDTNDSVFYIGENVGLKIYSQQIQKKLPHLLSKLSNTLHKIRHKHPRLYLLNDNQLLSMLSASPNLEPLIIKCFPHLKEVDIKQGAIERVGKKKHLKFIEPIGVYERLGAVKEWMTTLEQKMKYTLKEIYKKSSMLTIGKNLSDAQGIQRGDRNKGQSTTAKHKQHKPSPSSTAVFQSQSINYPLQLSILEEHIWFTQKTQQSILNSQLSKLFEQICEKIITMIKMNCDSVIVLLYVMFREIISRLVNEDVTSIKDYSWLKEVHVYPLTATIKNYNLYTSSTQLPFIEPQIVIMSQQYQFGWTYYQQPEIFFSNGKASFHGNTFIGSNNSGKSSVCRYYAQLTGNQMILFEHQSVNSNQSSHNKSQNTIERLINYIKLICHIGGWLFVNGVEKFQSYEELSVLAMCMETVNKTIIQKSTKISLFGDSINLASSYPRMFLSLPSFTTQTSLPSILLQTLRPMFITKLDDFYLLRLYLETRTFESDKILEWIRFITEVQHHEDYVKVIIQWMKRESSREDFVTKKLLAKLVQNGYSQKLFHLLQQNSYNESKQQSSNHNNIEKFLQNEVSFLNYDGMVVYGSRNIGKTHQLLNTLKKYNYVYVDMRIYPKNLKAASKIVTEFGSFNPMPEFLLVRDGIEYYQIFSQLKQKSTRLIYIQTELKYINASFLYNLKVLNFQRLIQTNLEQTSMTAKKQFCQRTFDLSKQITLNIIGKESYYKIFTPQSLQNKILSILDSIIQKSFPSSNIKIAFAKLYQSTLLTYNNESIVFLFAIIWSYGQFTTQNVLIQKLQENYSIQNEQQEEQIKSSDKKSFRQIPQLVNTITNWLKEGKILSLMDLRPVKCENTKICRFENNFTAKYETLSPVCLGEKMYLELGMLSNISLLHYLNPELSIKVKTKSWLTTILQSIKNQFQNSNNDIILLRQSQNFRFDELINRLLYQVKKNKSKFIFSNRKRILVDDVHLLNQNDYKYLEHLAKHKLVLYIDNDSQKKGHGHSTTTKSFPNNGTPSYVNHFSSILTHLTLQNCSFTLGTKVNPTFLQNQKSIVIRLNEPHTQTIFYQFVRVFLSNKFTVDMSVAQLLSFSHQVTKRYQQKNFIYGHHKQVPYYLKDQLQFQNRKIEIKGTFWFRNPLFLAIKSQRTKVSQIYEEYLRIVCDMLPQEAKNVKRLHDSITQRDRSQKLGLYLVFIVFQLQVMSQYANILTSRSEISHQSQCEAMTKKSPIYDLTLNRSIFQSQTITKLFQILADQEETFNPNISALTVYNNLSKQNRKSELNERMKVNIIKTYRQLETHHVILLGDIHTQREKISKYACRLLKYKLVDFHEQRLLKKLISLSNDQLQNEDFKIAIFFKSSDLNGPVIKQLIKIIKEENLSYWIQDEQPIEVSQKNNEQTEDISRPSEMELKRLFKKLRFILKFNNSQQSPNKYYSLYPQLSSLFVTLTFPSYQQPIIEEQLQMLTTLSEKSLSSQQEFICIRQKLSWKSDIKKLSSKHSISKDFIVQFPALFLHNSELEYQKLEYYRKITSQMVVNIDRLTSYNNQIPNKIAQINQICSKISSKKTSIRKNTENLNIEKQNTTQKISKLKELLEKTKQNDNILINHFDKIAATTQAKMEKYQKKLDGLDASEYVKLKYVNKNEVGVGLMINLLNFIANNKLIIIMEQSQKVSVSQPIQLSHQFSKMQILTILRQIHQSSTSIIQSQPQLLTAISQQNLTYIIEKLQELRQMGMKKFEKLGVIWKCLWEWLMADGEREEVLRGYVEKAREIALAYNKLYGISNELHAIENNISVNQDIEHHQKDITPIPQSNDQESLPIVSQSNNQEHLSVDNQQALKFKKIQISTDKQSHKLPFNTSESFKQLISQKVSISLVSKKHLQKIIDEQTSKLSQLSDQMFSLETQRSSLFQNQSSLIKYRQFLQQKRINLTRVISCLSDKEYMKSVSSNIASYFRDIPKIAFLKTLSQQKYNQHIDDSIIAGYQLPPDHNYNIFSRDESIRLFKQKYHLYQMLEQEIECLFNVINNRKPMVVVQDEEGVIVRQLISICGVGLGYEIVQIKRHHRDNQLKDVVMKKLRNHHLVLVVLEGTLLSHHSQRQKSQHQQTQHLFSSLYKQFFSRNKQTQQKRLIIIYDTKLQLRTQFYDTISIGRVVLGYERFVNDFVDAMDVISGEKKKLQSTKYSSALFPSNTSALTPLQSLQANYPKLYSLISPKTHEISSQESIDIANLHQEQLQLLINEENTKMKQNLKNISKLTQIMVDTNYSVIQTTKQEIALSLQTQNNFIEQIQSNLLQISVIHEIVETNYKNSTLYKQLQPPTKHQVDKLSIGFYILFVYLNALSKRTDSPMFGGRAIYHDWLRVVKQVKAENHDLLLDRVDRLRYLDVKDIHDKEIIINQAAKSTENKQSFQQNNKPHNTAISTAFAANIDYLIKSLLIKLIKSIKWLRKEDLYQFLLMGIVVLEINNYVNLTGVDRVEQLRETIVANVSSGSSQIKSGQTCTISKTIQPNRFELISSLLNLLKSPKQYRPYLLIDALHAGSEKLLYSPQIIQIYKQLESNKTIHQLLKQVLALKYDYQLIRVNKYEMKGQVFNQSQIDNKSTFLKTFKSATEYLSLKLTLQVRQSELTTPITIIEDNEQAIPQLLFTLKHRAKYYKREFLTMVYLEHQTQKMSSRIKQIYEKGKAWVWWVNIGHEGNCWRWMEHLISQTNKYPQNKYVKMFILFPKQQIIRSRLSYDKYSVSKIVGDSILDFQQLIKFILSIATNLQSSFNQFSNSLSKIKLSGKSFNQQGDNNLFGIYQVLIIGFRLLSQKSHIFNSLQINSFQSSSQLTWHLLSYIKTFESLYTLQQLHSLPKSNAAKYISEYCYLLDETCTLEKVQKDIEICQKLIQEGLDYRGLDGEMRTEEKRKRSLTYDDSDNNLIQHISQHQLFIKNAQQLISNPISNVNQTKENSIINPMQSALYTLSLQTILASNKIYYQNVCLNQFLQKIHDVYKSVGLDLHQSQNSTFYQNASQQLFWQIKQRYRQLIETYVPIKDLKTCNSALSKQTIRIESSIQLHNLLLLVKCFIVKRQGSASHLTQQNRKQSNSMSSKRSPNKQQTIFTKDSKYNNERSPDRNILDKIILGQFLIQPLNGDENFNTADGQLLPFNLSSIAEHFVNEKILKCSFALYLKQRSSLKQETLKRKTRTNYFGDSIAIPAISKKQLSKIIQTFVLVLDWSKIKNKREDPNQQIKWDNKNGLTEICLLQAFMK